MGPIKPVTPPGSLFWRILHFPPLLIIIGMVMVIGPEIIVSMIAHFVVHAQGPLGTLATALCETLAAVAGYVLFVRFVERRPAVSEFAAPGWSKELGAGLLTGLLLFSLVVAVIALFGGYHVIGEHPVTALFPVLALSLVSGVGEEIVVRGIIFRLVESSLGSWIALIFSAALFGAGHLGNAHAGLLPAVAIALEAGIMLAALYMLTRRLWAAIGVHAAWNFTQGGIYGIAVSGNAVDGALIPRISGPDLLTGGAFGAEASLPAILICTIFGVVVTTIAYRRGRFVKPFWARTEVGARANVGEADRNRE
ncbi:type II CAAX endopeptidase family protein [Sphingomonas oligophenolica]|uniref:CPBP family intramembrane glutamic endopeptidase n=1 Tax=Sphingomonas oligophenolica TaxID=301154 RepID=A0ABU9Y004_9SPHN